MSNGSGFGFNKVLVPYCDYIPSLGLTHSLDNCFSTTVQPILTM